MVATKGIRRCPRSPLGTISAPIHPSNRRHFATQTTNQQLKKSIGYLSSVVCRRRHLFERAFAKSESAASDDDAIRTVAAGGNGKIGNRLDRHRTRTEAAASRATKTEPDDKTGAAIARPTTPATTGSEASAEPASEAADGVSGGGRSSRAATEDDCADCNLNNNGLVAVNGNVVSTGPVDKLQASVEEMRRDLQSTELIYQFEVSCLIQ